MKIRLDRGVIRWWLIALGLVLAWPSLIPALVGTVMIALGMVIHLWSKGCLQQNRQLTVCGPYRWTRNPFYVANFLIDVGLCLFINCIWLTVPFVIAWIVVYRWQILSEERTLEGIYGEAWANYKKNVPPFLPYKRPYRDVPADQGFAWSNPNLAQSREVPRLIRTASYPLLLLVAAKIGPMMWLHERTADLAWLAGPVGTACLSGIVALQFVGWALKKQLHNRQPVLPKACRDHWLQLALMLVYLAVLAATTLGFARPDGATIGVGIAMLLLGFYAVQRRQKSSALLWDAVAWSAALGAAGLLAGLPWAAILAVALGLAISIDAHIGDTWSFDFPSFDALSPEPSAAKKPLWDRLGLAGYYTLFSLAVLAIATSKQFLSVSHGG